MTRNLFLVPYGVNFAKPTTVRQLVYPIALEDAVDSSTRDIDVMVTDQIPDNANWPQMIGWPRCRTFSTTPVGVRLVGFSGIGFLLIIPASRTFFIECLPAIKSGPTNTEISASSNGTANRFSMIENA